MMLVNYVWFSRALRLAPSGCVKVVDTHDVFGDRHKRLVADGVAPAWFYTTPEQEGLGLDRADAVIAIQEDEANVLRARTRTPVIVVGHLLPANFRPPRKTAARPTVGYIASTNPTNVYSYRRLEEAIRRRPGVEGKFDFMLAGPICRVVSPTVFRTIGEVGDVESFYDEADIVVNPNLGGTGLKIKSVEALSYGRPFVCTADSMIGVETQSAAHRCSDPEEIVAALDDLQSIEALAAASRAAFAKYQQTQLAAVERLISLRREPAPARRWRLGL
jgi:hypothetical protein